MAKAKAVTGPFELGQQSNGSIVVLIPDDSHLVTARKAFEKQLKNAGAARGTMSALKDASDPLIDEVERELQALIRVFAGARAPEKQISGTPIGDALDKAVAAGKAGVKGEQIDGKDPGIVWAPHVPTPRPRLGQLVVHPAGGAGVGITDLDGYSIERDGFDVKVGAASYLVRPHFERNGDGDARSPAWRLVWRLVGEQYSTPLVKPNAEGAGPQSVGAELEDAASEGTRAAERDLAADAAEETPVGTDAAGEPQAVAPTTGARGKRAGKASASPTPTKTEAKRSPAQRERNARTNGLGGTSPRGAKKRPGGR